MTRHVSGGRGQLTAGEVAAKVKAQGTEGWHIDEEMGSWGVLTCEGP